MTDAPRDAFWRAAMAELQEWVAPDAAQEGLRRGYLEHLRDQADGAWRSCRDGHLTSSGLIVDPPGERVLLTLHPTVGRWLQTGGHCEPGDASLADAALREAREESGLSDLVVVGAPLRLDRHAVDCRGDDGHRTRLDHLDVQWCVVATGSTRAVASEESADLDWWPWDRLPAGPTGVDNSVRALVGAARERLRSAAWGG